MVKRKKLIQADTTAILFTLKTRDPERWNAEESELAKARIAKVKLETDKIEKGEDIGSLIVQRLASYVSRGNEDEENE